MFGAELELRTGYGFKHMIAMAMVAMAFKACVSGSEVRDAERGAGRGPEEWQDVTT